MWAISCMNVARSFSGDAMPSTSASAKPVVTRRVAGL